MDILIMDALMIGTLGWCIDQTEGENGKKG